MTTDNRYPSRLARFALPAGVLLILLFLLIRNHGLYPLIFLDEWSYSRYSRLAPLGEAIVPSYLYLWLFRATNACGPEFLECARLGNTVLYLLAAPFLYRVALPLAGRAAAVMITLSILLGGTSVYTAFFMPEATYFLCFWVLTWLVLEEIGGTGVRGAVWTGITLGLMSLVKVHALFLLPAIMVYAIWRNWRDGRTGVGLVAAVVMGLCLLAVKWGLGWLLAGPAGLDVLGSFYGNQTGSDSSPLRLLQPALWNLYGHAMALVLLWALPLVAVATAATSPAVRAAAGKPGLNALVYTVLTLGATMALTVAFTASIAHVGPNEVSRLHMRYYGFVLPLLPMLAASPLLVADLGQRLRAVLAVLFAVLTIYAAMTLFRHFPYIIVDSPELTNLRRFRAVFNLLVLTQLVLVGLWVWRPAVARRGFIWVLLPLLAINSAVTSTRMLMALSGNSLPADRAGRAMYQQFTPQQRDHLVLAGPNDADLYRAQFQVDRHASKVLIVPPGAPITAGMLPPGTEALMVLGQQPLAPDLAPQVVTADYTLTRMPPKPLADRVVTTVYFQGQPNAGLVTTSGLSTPELWGTWSDSNKVVLRFAQPLPRHMLLTINAKAFGRNIGAPIGLTVGAARHELMFIAGVTSYNVRVDTDGRQTELVFDIPHPTSPSSLAGGKGDPRPLGLGLVDLTVGAFDQP